MARPKRYDASRLCPKCGGGVGRRYCTITEPGIIHAYSTSHGSHEYVPEGGHLHRECACGFSWIELPKDAPLMAERLREERITLMNVKHIVLQNQVLERIQSK